MGPISLFLLHSAAGAPPPTCSADAVATAVSRAGSSCSSAFRARSAVGSSTSEPERCGCLRRLGPAAYAALGLSDCCGVPAEPCADGAPTLAADRQACVDAGLPAAVCSVAELQEGLPQDAALSAPPCATAAYAAAGSLCALSPPAGFVCESAACAAGSGWAWQWVPSAPSCLAASDACSYDALVVPGSVLASGTGCQMGRLVAAGASCQFRRSGFTCTPAACAAGQWVPGAVSCSSERGTTAPREQLTGAPAAGGSAPQGAPVTPPSQPPTAAAAAVTPNSESSGGLSTVTVVIIVVAAAVTVVCGCLFYWSGQRSQSAAQARKQRSAPAASTAKAAVAEGADPDAEAPAAAPAGGQLGRDRAGSLAGAAHMLGARAGRRQSAVSRGWNDAASDDFSVRGMGAGSRRGTLAPATAPGGQFTGDLGDTGAATFRGQAFPPGGDPELHSHRYSLAGSLHSAAPHMHARRASAVSAVSTATPPGDTHTPALEAYRLRVASLRPGDPATPRAAVQRRASLAQSVPGARRDDGTVVHGREVSLPVATVSGEPVELQLLPGAWADAPTLFGLKLRRMLLVTCTAASAADLAGAARFAGRRLTHFCGAPVPTRRHLAAKAQEGWRAARRAAKRGDTPPPPPTLSFAAERRVDVQDGGRAVRELDQDGFVARYGVAEGMRRWAQAPSLLSVTQTERADPQDGWSDTTTSTSSSSQSGDEVDDPVWASEIPVRPSDEAVPPPPVPRPPQSPPAPASAPAPALELAPAPRRRRRALSQGAAPRGSRRRSQKGRGLALSYAGSDPASYYFAVNSPGAVGLADRAVARATLHSDWAAGRSLPHPYGLALQPRATADVAPLRPAPGAPEDPGGEWLRARGAWCAPRRPSPLRRRAQHAAAAARRALSPPPVRETDLAVATLRQMGGTDAELAAAAARQWGGSARDADVAWVNTLALGPGSPRSPLACTARWQSPSPPPNLLGAGRWRPPPAGPAAPQPAQDEPAPRPPGASPPPIPARPRPPKSWRALPGGPAPDTAGEGGGSVPAGPPPLPLRSLSAWSLAGHR
eukprot:TRINITY_DN5329_c2_g1_i1.p1 TRINITY_DN5329_c2_g1~~TRINITY_DN5329_c2_g1_i1.p1  ORF type:complete len:1088 (+),score=136.23 TRINITY_DN5329_c2_g1_i1:106-3264(+)